VAGGAQGTEVGEDMITHAGQHGLAAEMAEAGPAAFLFRDIFFVGRPVGGWLGGGGEEVAREGLAFVGAVPAFLLGAFTHVEQAGEHEEGNLFDDGERVGDATRPELFPELIDAAAKWASDHAALVLASLRFERADDVEEFVSQGFVEQAVEAIGVKMGEGRFVEPIHFDRAVPGNVVLQ
jgi:hypothetical protein